MKILILLISVVSISFCDSLQEQMMRETSVFLTLIFWGFKLGGLGVIIWGVSDLMSEDKKQNPYIKSVIKLIVGGIFIAVETLSNVLHIYANQELL